MLLPVVRKFKIRHFFLYFPFFMEYCMSITTELIPPGDISLSGGLEQLDFNVTIWKAEKAEERTALTCLNHNI